MRLIQGAVTTVLGVLGILKSLTLMLGRHSANGRGSERFGRLARANWGRSYSFTPWHLVQFLSLRAIANGLKPGNKCVVGLDGLLYRDVIGRDEANALEQFTPNILH
jgi:hypothetical protein